MIKKIRGIICGHISRNMSSEGFAGNVCNCIRRVKNGPRWAGSNPRPPGEPRPPPAPPRAPRPTPRVGRRPETMEMGLRRRKWSIKFWITLQTSKKYEIHQNSTTIWVGGQSRFWWESVHRVPTASGPSKHGLEGFHCDPTLPIEITKTTLRKIYERLFTKKNI